MSSNKAKTNKKININLIPLSEAAKRSGYTPEYLNLLSRKGILKAEKVGRNWHTTQEWLDEFIAETTAKRSKAAEVENITIQEPVEIVSNETQELGVVETREIESGKDEKVEGIEEAVQEGNEDRTGEKIEEKISAKKEKAPWQQVFAGLSSMIIVLPMIFFVVYSTKYYVEQKRNHEEKIALIENSPQGVIMNESGIEDDENLSEQKINGVVSGEETNATDEAAKRAGILLASENYKASQLTVGGVIAVANAEENSPLEISDVKSESFITNSKNNQGSSKEEVKLVVSWKTNKLAMSQLSYSKNNGQDTKTIKEQSFGFNHSVIITQITPRTSYVYQIKARDHWGTEINSDFYGIFTTSKPVSVFDLISEQINQIFGWAVKN